MRKGKYMLWLLLLSALLVLGGCGRQEEVDGSAAVIYAPAGR